VYSAVDGGAALQAVPRPRLDAAAPRADTRRGTNAFTTLGFLAARTERVRLGTMVAAATFWAAEPAGRDG
jgi:alkanesulfonate monooxygenase SsuD/methylene tetrahydromethanopterin reductase-like flavin-dependent oxidoreductase (luciferase family)